MMTATERYNATIQAATNDNTNKIINDILKVCDVYATLAQSVGNYSTEELTDGLVASLKGVFKLYKITDSNTGHNIMKMVEKLMNEKGYIFDTNSFSNDAYVIKW